MLRHISKVSYAEGTYILEGIVMENQCWACFSDSNMEIRCYDVESSNHVLTLTGHTAPITDLARLSDGNMLLSSQRDTGVMISDLRSGKPEHFLTELTGKDLECCSIATAADDKTLAVAVNGDIELVDIRTWTSFRKLPEVHMDEIARLRFCGENELCSAGEDQMINFYDLRQQKDKDIMVSMINCGEVITRMTHFPQFGLMGMVGSCENSYLVPTDLSHEKRIDRPNFETYMGDFCAIGDESNSTLLLVVGDNSFETGVGPLHVVDPFTKNELLCLKGVHKDMVRVVLGVSNQIITAGDDGCIAYWSPDMSSLPASAANRLLKEPRFVPDATKALRKKRNPY